MRKLSEIFILSLLAAVVSSFTLQAEVVSRKEASRVAFSFLNPGVAVQTSSAELPLLWDSRDLCNMTRSTTGSLPAFYVFGLDSDQGFIIISAEDAVTPVLGYSRNSRMPEPGELPENLESWMSCVSSAIETVRKEHLEASPEIRRRWNRTAAGTVEILYETALWGQYGPFNLFCPIDQNGEKSITGCIATATAIIMRHYGWPEKGYGSTREYLLKTGVRVPSRDLEHEYHWDNMPLNLRDENYNFICTREQAEEIATLMADVGAAYQLEYSAQETYGYLWTNARRVGDHFFYGPLESYEQKDKRPLGEWYKFLREQLKTGPLLYRGSDSDGNGGHIFVLDGVTDQNHFHVNWGWDGFANGFYALDIMEPEGTEYSFSFFQGMVPDFKPNKETPVKVSLDLQSPGLIAVSDVLKAGETASLNDVMVRNNSDDTFKGQIALALLTDDHQMQAQKILGKTEVPSGRTLNLKNLSMELDEDVRSGYELCLVYAASFMPHSWYRISSPDEAAIPGSVFLTILQDLDETTSISFDRGSECIRVKHLEGLAAKVFYGDQEVTAGISVPDDQTLVIDVSALDPTLTYTLRLINGKQTREISFEVRPSAD